jgi:hypothetical protein
MNSYIGICELWEKNNSKEEQAKNTLRSIYCSTSDSRTEYSS